jgi:hypothetical protein
VNGWLGAAVGALVGAAVAAVVSVLVRRAMGRRPPGGAETWTRINHSGAPVSLLEGPAAGAGLILGGAAGAFVMGGAAAAGAVAVAGAAGLGFGLLDDLAEDTSQRRKGLRGHLGALLHGELTTGGVKVLGIGIGSLLAATLLPHTGGTLLLRVLDWLGQGAFIAVSANLMNLLDLRPGRSLKAAVVQVPVLLLLGGPAAGAGGAVAGTSVGVGKADLEGRDMLGDAGANALGAVLAVGLTVGVPAPVRWVLLGLGLGLTVLSERVSFTRIIERTPVLKQIDAWGR